MAQFYKPTRKTVILSQNWLFQIRNMIFTSKSGKSKQYLQPEMGHFEPKWSFSSQKWSCPSPKWSFWTKKGIVLEAMTAKNDSDLDVQNGNNMSQGVHNVYNVKSVLVMIV